MSVFRRSESAPLLAKRAVVEENLCPRDLAGRSGACL
jgi:hypothetical protein